MKHIVLLVSLCLISCDQQKKHEGLSSNERSQIKEEIIESYEKHINDLKNLDYEEVMKYYANIDDHILFGDGSEWGDFTTVDAIWKSFCTQEVKSILKWDLSNHQVHAFSRDAASYLVQFDNERIQTNGDTTKVTGCFSYGMQKIDDNWKVVTTHVSHNYKEGYDPRVKNK